MSSIADFVRSDRPLVTAGAAAYPFSTKLELKYRFTSRFDDTVLLHRVVGDRILLPRALCPVGLSDERDPGKPVSFPKMPPPRPSQVQVFADTIAFLKAGHSGIVAAHTGFGKTVLGYRAAAELGVKTVVVTTKDDIYKQWLVGAKQFLGLEDHEIGEIRQDHCEVVGTKFVVAMIHSLSKPGKYPDWIVNGFGLVIFDEVHRLPADQFAAVADIFPARLRLGLSAQVQRADGKELLLMAHIGPIRVRTEGHLMVPKVLRYVSGWQCPRVWRHDEDGSKTLVRLPHEPGKTTHLEKVLAADQDRNELIAGVVAVALGKGRKIAVFSTLHEHLKALHRLLLKAGVPGKDVGFYIGAASKAERAARERVKVKPVILTTYGMMGEGTDLPWLDTCVLAIPRSNVVQPVGRIQREYEGKAEPVVIDVVDTDSPVFAGYADSRRGWYRKTGCQVMDMQ